jgi:hypothetical protein
MNPPFDDSRPPAPLREYRLLVRAGTAGQTWRAELHELHARGSQPPRVFDTPLELARHLSGTPAPHTGLR